MKKIWMTALLVAFLGTAASTQAQNSSETSLKVTVIAEKESVRTGPYARFAQKFLGVMAPLSDKDSYVLVDGMIESSDAMYPSYYGLFDVNSRAAGVSAISHVISDTSFVKVNVDRRDIVDRNLESMAMDAANTIFMLRKRRMELITGEAGENVFGAGLQDALNEITRVENEYLALFLGKQFRERIVKVYDVTPQGDKPTTVVCRFSEGAGLVSSTDLSGRPVILEVVVEQQAAQPIRKGGKEPVIQEYVPSSVVCRLLDGKHEITQNQILMTQFGTPIYAPMK